MSRAEGSGFRISSNCMDMWPQIHWFQRRLMRFHRLWRDGAKVLEFATTQVCASSIEQTAQFKVQRDLSTTPPRKQCSTS